MKRNLPSNSFLTFVILMLTSMLGLTAQTTVFSEDFTTSAGTAYTTTPGLIGTSTKWTHSESGNDFGSKIDGGRLTVTNDATAAANLNGWALASTATGAFTAPYNTTLSSNSGSVIWTFNMRHNRSNPSGFGSSNYGDAYILAGSAGTTNLSGTGYAIIHGNGNSNDPVRLVRYNAGIRNFTTLISSNTSNLNDLGREYLSIKVIYTPSTNVWQFYLRNDGTTAFADPATGTLTLQGSVTNNNYTGTALPIMGGYWNAATVAAATVFFDNIKVAVTVPAITSITPPSKVAGSAAFTLIVAGSNFVSGVSTVNWNGTPRTTLTFRQHRSMPQSRLPMFPPQELLLSLS